MAMLQTKFLALFVWIFPISSSWAVTFDWSGWSRLEAYYQKDHYYGAFAFALNSKLHIRDGISFNFRADLVDFQGDWEKFWKNPDLTKNPYHQRGYVFLYKALKNKAPLPFVFPSQFYLDYQGEFFKIRAGRAPFHFGLGANHSATQNPFSLWLSSPDQISIYMEYDSFYLQPSVFHYFSENHFSALLQAGLSQKNWKASALYEHPFSQKSPRIELYGEYEQALWNVKINSTYSGKNSFSALLEALYRLNSPSPIDLKLKAGWVSMRLHPNYNIGLLTANRRMLKEAADFYQIAQGKLEDILYFSPYAVFYLLEKNLKLEPLFLLAYHKDQFQYEWDLSGQYKIQDSLFFDLTAGALYQKNWSFGLLAQAAVSF